MTYTRSSNTIINDTAGGDSVKAALTTRLSTAVDNLYAVANLIDADVVTAQAAADGKPSLGESSTTAYRGDRGKTAYDHSQTAHAPANAQKNSDILKAEIEAVLTGELSSHSHAAATLPTASVTVSGVVELATDAEVATLTDTGRAITPSGLASVFAKSIGSAGYQKFPGGMILQWGSNAVNADSTLAVTLPVTFPTAHLQALATRDASNTSLQDRVGANPTSTSQVTLQNSSGQTTTVRWLCIGN